MNFKELIIYILLLIILIWVYYLSWITWILDFIISIIIYNFIFFWFHKLIKKIRKKESLNLKEFSIYFIKRISLFLSFLIVFFSLLTYTINEYFPAKMPEFTISNWEKIVKFQAMSHIWTDNFYNEIKENLREFKKEWWVYFFEWVKSWTKENQDKFNQALWIEFSPDLYKNFSKLYWVSYQDNNIFYWLENDLDFNVDLNIDEIIWLYEEKIKDKNIEEKEALDINNELINQLANLNEKQLQILVYINQAILNFIIWSDSTQSFLSDNFTNTDLFDVILHKRNEVLANEIIESEYDKIFITYWLLHFNWVFEIVKEQDENWKIIETKYLYPIKN